MVWSVVRSLAGVRPALRVPVCGVRSMHATPALGNKGRARKSPKTLLRLYAEGQLKGPEARQAAALLAEQNSEKGLRAPPEATRTSRVIPYRCRRRAA